MKINTKFDIGQKVYVIYNCHIFETKIAYIEVFKINNTLIIRYRYFLKGSCELYSSGEDELFVTREEAKAKLKEIPENE